LGGVRGLGTIEHEEPRLGEQSPHQRIRKRFVHAFKSLQKQTRMHDGLRTR